MVPTLFLSAPAYCAENQGQQFPAIEVDKGNTNTPKTLTPSQKKLSKPPPGFEYLLEPQTTEVDVYYGGQYVGSLMATYSPGEITFLQPQTLTNLIPQVIDRERLTQHFTGKLNSHAYAVCQNTFSTDCGKLNPEIAAVIFDESRYRVDVFVAASELHVQTLNIPKFLPPSDSGLSFIHGLSANISKPEGSSDNYSINGHTLLGFKESRIRMLSNISKTNDFAIDTLAYEHDYAGRSYQLGLLQTNNQRSVFLPNLQIAGARFASTLDTRNDLDFSEGSPLNIFLSSRSRIEIYKDDRLVSSDIYDAGNQSLDTQSLEGGAYYITLRIYEGDRLVREEQRFYRKSGQMPPSDQDLFFIEGGRIMESNTSGNNSLNAMDDVLLRGGYASRVTDGLALDANLALTETDKMLEAGFYHLNPYFDLDMNIAYTENHDTGFFGNFNTRWRDLLISADYRKIDLSDPVRDDNDIYLLGDANSEQGSIRLSHPFYSGRISFESRYLANDVSTTTSHTASVNFPRYKFDDKTYLNSNIEVTKQDAIWQALLRVSLNFSTGRTQYRVTSTQQQVEGGEERHSTTGSINWNDQELLVSDLDLNLNVQSGHEQQQADAGAKWESRYGRLSASVDQSHSAGSGTTTGYSAGLSTTIIGDSEGLVIGGNENNQSAVIIDIESPHKQSSVDVFVDGGKRAYAVSGKSTVVSLKPFESYNISINDTGTDLLSYSQREDQVTLYPGNVARLKYRIKKVDVVFGRILDKEANPIKNALIEGVEGLAITDEYGFFQAEMSTSTDELTIRSKKGDCQVSVPDYTAKNQIARLGTLRCE
jgi:hypothetical protein